MIAFVRDCTQHVTSSFKTSANVEFLLKFPKVSDFRFPQFKRVNSSHQSQCGTIRRFWNLTCYYCKKDIRMSSHTSNWIRNLSYHKSEHFFSLNFALCCSSWSNSRRDQINSFMPLGRGPRNGWILGGTCLFTRSL